eukprot:TRINITY_DN9672_c0_g1_i1.p2 TRINITY_DN9672_c0_g1~~TRINITY_DN9672_c0_g1_i1.p2  ORF type:complete len:130 (+),score=23.14 TRINITY_DN9672_c0_g1_i1:163-552(+)
MNFKDEYTKFVNEYLVRAIQNHRKMADQVLEERENVCFAKAGRDADYFVDCTKKYETEFMQSFERLTRRTTFVERSLYNCMEKADEEGFTAGAFDQCRNDARKEMKRILADFRKIFQMHDIPTTVKEQQ